MKNSILMLGFVTLMTLTTCNNSDNNTKTDDQETEHAVSVYTCPMHAEIVSDKPGKCPKCNMELVKNEK